jgi:hypothetical protein
MVMTTSTTPTGTMPTGTASAAGPTDLASRELSLTRLYAMRAGYALMAFGLMLVKWPLLPNAHTMPLYEGVSLMLLTAMSLLALLGLRHPVKLLPVLLFETIWKLLWLCAVALPEALTGGLSDRMSAVAFNCSLVVFIIAAMPWKYMWAQYWRSNGDRWR